MGRETRLRSVKFRTPGIPHSSAPSPGSSRVNGQKPGRIEKKTKKVGPLTRQEHPVLAVRVRGRRPYDRSDRRPHFKIAFKIAVGWGPESPVNVPEMHPACQSRFGRENFLGRQGEAAADQMLSRINGGCCPAFRGRPCSLERYGAWPVIVATCDSRRRTAGQIAARAANCSAPRADCNGLPVHWTGAV